MEEAGLRFQGRGLRPGTTTSPTCTPTPEGSPCRAGELLQRVRTTGPDRVRTGSQVSSWFCVVSRLGLLDPDLPPPGPPSMRSFKVRNRTW